MPNSHAYQELVIDIDSKKEKKFAIKSSHRGSLSPTHDNIVVSSEFSSNVKYYISAAPKHK